MSRPVLRGFPQSSYMMTARAVAALKGVDVDFQPIAPGENRRPEWLALNPFGKVPVLQHGDLTLYETSAISRYLDEAFDGPALVPDNAHDRARMEQWVSVVNCYFYPRGVGGFILKVIFAGPEGPDMAAIAANQPALDEALDILDAGVGEGTFLVGDTPTLADLFVAPILMGIGRMPGGRQMLDKRPGLGRMVGALVQTPGFMSAFQGA